MGRGEDGDLLGDLERRALEAAAESSRSMGEEEIDVVESLKGGGEAEKKATDATLGGYIAKHDRPPAFEGEDEQPYTVAIDVEDQGEDGPRRFAAFLVFVRWAETGAGIMAHVESDDVAHGATEDEAKARALDLTLHEVKAELDAAIERRRADLED